MLKTWWRKWWRDQTLKLIQKNYYLKQYNDKKNEMQVFYIFFFLLSIFSLSLSSFMLLIFLYFPPVISICL